MTTDDQILKEVSLRRYYNQLQRHADGLRKNNPECDKLVMLIIQEYRESIPYTRALEPRRGFFGESEAWFGPNRVDLYRLIVERFAFPTTNEKGTRGTINATLSDLFKATAMRRVAGLFDFNDNSPATLVKWFERKLEGRRGRPARGAEARKIKSERLANVQSAQA